MPVQDLIACELRLLSIQHVKARQRAGADAGWEWDSPWEVELSPYVDKEGWAYAPDWAAMDWPPQNGAQVTPACFYTSVPSCVCNSVDQYPSVLVPI